MGLLETAREIRAGKQKLADVPEGVRKQVQRLLPVAGDAPTPIKHRIIGTVADGKYRRFHSA